MTTVEDRVRMAIAGLSVIVDQSGVVIPVAYVVALLKAILGEGGTFFTPDFTPLTNEQIEAIRQVPEGLEKNHGPSDL